MLLVVLFQKGEGTYGRSILPSLTAVSWRVSAGARGRATAAESRADAGFPIGRAALTIHRDVATCRGASAGAALAADTTVGTGASTIAGDRAAGPQG
jgi:hypothetical protein